MEHAAGNTSLTIALALAAGVIGQSIARHLRIPGIVILLLAGVVLGPDIAHLIDPQAVEHALHELVGFAVAVILFEGGLNLEFRRLRREAGVIQRLITLGAIITAAGSAVAARLILEWSWINSVLFGTLVIVTGPTVVTPLLRRFKIKTNLQTILEAEGVFIDAVGAIVAIVALDVALQPSGTSFAAGLLGAFGRFGLGVFFGVIGGAIIALLLRPRRLVPEGLENIFALSLAWLLFQVSNAILPESGIATVTVAGVIVGNVKSHVSRELIEFKEQLTVLLIGMLFVLLAADVRISEVRSLGMPGLYTVLAVMFLVRPLVIAACTVRSNLTFRERLFLSWLAPRGIVAAAVASLFAQTLEEAGMEGGTELRALVFLVIAVTVVLQGLSGGWVARWLGLKRPTNYGYAILGASDLGRAVGRVLSDDKAEIMFLDSNAESFRAAKDEGFRVVFGNALEESTLARAQVDTRAACVALTTNEEINLLFAQRVREEFKASKVLVALQSGHSGVTPERVEKAGAKVLFGRPRDLELWDVRFRRQTATFETWELVDAASEDGWKSLDENSPPRREWILELVYRRGKKRHLFSTPLEPKKGDRVRFALLRERREQVSEWMENRGWSRVPEAASEAAESGGQKATGATETAPAGA